MMMAMKMNMMLPGCMLDCKINSMKKTVGDRMMLHLNITMSIKNSRCLLRAAHKAQLVYC